jgi:hypothetical protein
MTNEEVWQKIVTKQTDNPNNKFLKWENDLEGCAYVWWKDENGDNQYDLISWRELFFILMGIKND